jgi:hypothetical protein
VREWRYSASFCELSHWWSALRPVPTPEETARAVVDSFEEGSLPLPVDQRSRCIDYIPGSLKCKGRQKYENCIILIRRNLSSCNFLKNFFFASHSPNLRKKLTVAGESYSGVISTFALV